jgi:hypothetical protein
MPLRRLAATPGLRDTLTMKPLTATAQNRKDDKDNNRRSQEQHSDDQERAEVHTGASLRAKLNKPKHF